MSVKCLLACLLVQSMSAVLSVALCPPLPSAQSNCCGNSGKCCRDWSSLPQTYCPPASNPEVISVTQENHTLMFQWSLKNKTNVLGYRLEFSCRWSRKTIKMNRTECFELSGKDTSIADIAPYACKQFYTGRSPYCVHSSMFTEFYKDARQDDFAQCHLKVMSLPLASSSVVTKTFTLSSCRALGCPNHAFTYRHTCNRNNILTQVYDPSDDRPENRVLCKCKIRPPSHPVVSINSKDVAVVQWQTPDDDKFSPAMYEIVVQANTGVAISFKSLRCNGDQHTCQTNITQPPDGGYASILSISNPPQTRSEYVSVKVPKPGGEPTTRAVTSEETIQTNDRSVPTGKKPPVTAVTRRENEPAETLVTDPTRGYTPSSHPSSSAPTASDSSPPRDSIMVVILVVVVVLVVCVGGSIFAKLACRKYGTKGPVPNGKSMEMMRGSDPSVAYSSPDSESSECTKFSPALDSPRPYSGMSNIPTPVFISYARFPDSNVRGAESLARQLFHCGVDVRIASENLNTDPDFLGSKTMWIGHQIGASRHILLIVSEYHPHCCNAVAEQLSQAAAASQLLTPSFDNPSVPVPVSEDCDDNNVNEKSGFEELRKRIVELMKVTHADRMEKEQMALANAANAVPQNENLAELELEPLAFFEHLNLSGLIMDPRRARDIIPVYLDQRDFTVELPVYLRSCHKYFVNVFSRGGFGVPPNTGTLEDLVRRLHSTTLSR